MFRYISGIFIFWFLTSVQGFGQNYSVDLIPDSLKTDANCVVRNFTREIVLQSVNCGIRKTHIAYTILNKMGEEDASLFIHYDQDTKAMVKQILMYDRNGKKIKKIKESEIVDVPSYNGALFTDDRVKHYEPNYAEYPYTIEYDYEIRSSNLISFGRWIPLDGYNISLQSAELSISYPKDIVVNIKEIGITGSEVPDLSANIKHRWVIAGLKSIDKEPYNTDPTERFPNVYLMPSVLKYNNYVGSARNWKDYGKWVYDLYVGKDELSEVEKQKISKLIENIPDTTQRIRALYKYIQSNTRYVGIQLGIGGFQPFSAKTVFETGYGDCKALTNYMHSLLKYIGVVSYPALVSSGRHIETILKDYPNFNQFDHVILCVPQQKDTVWLECTSQKMPFGFLGDFTDDRDVLLITSEGGKFAHTTNYDIHQNSRSGFSRISIDSTGTAQCDIKTTFHGLQYDNIFSFFYKNTDEQKKWLYENSLLPSIQISRFNVINTGLTPVAEISQTSSSSNYASFSGNYMLLPLNRINVENAIPKMIKNRTSDIQINRSSLDCDTIIYHTPKNFKLKNVPQGVTIESKFGRYLTSISVTNNEIQYIRSFEIKQGRYSSQEYKAFYDFMYDVSKADNAKLMIARNE